MRIIGGKFKGRNLVSFKADHIRPTTDRVKESIFNKLQNDIPGARVLDLFSGTGNLAIEALSRGAEHVVAVELSKKSLMIIKENLQILGIKSEIEVVPTDVLKYVRNHKGPPFDVILVDPPFTEKMADEVLETISARVLEDDQLMKPEAVIVIESSKHEVVKDVYAGIERFDHRDYGDKVASYFRLKG
jgi:16S rRNA (guanine966-N2)-methyltransferase